LHKNLRNQGYKKLVSKYKNALKPQNQKIIMKNNLERALGDFKNKNIAVIGDLMLDQTIRGIVSNKKNPEDSLVPIIKEHSKEFYLGGAGNVARNISSLGAKSVLYGIISKDDYKYRIKELAKEENVDISNLVEVNKSTIVKERFFIYDEVSEKFQYFHRFDSGEKNLEKISSKIQEEILLKITNNPNNFNAIILSDYDKHLFSENFTKKIINLAKIKGIPVFSDVKPVNINFFKGSYIVCPNEKEAQEITGIKYQHTPKTLFEMGKKICEKIKSNKAIITCGKEGAYVYDDGKSEMIKTKAREVIEVTGAGDTFISTLTLGMVSGLNAKEAVELANYASGIVVGKSGTSTTSVEEIIKRIEQENSKNH
jgi:D-glycero-beta-D-manno-heptose-7-phosphate kinase